MSQHKYSTITDGGVAVTVTMGYDRPLNYVFCTVLKEGDGEEDPLYTNLDDGKAGITQQDVDYYRPILNGLGVHVPDTIFEEVSSDQQYRVGNRNVEHSPE